VDTAKERAFTCFSEEARMREVAVDGVGMHQSGRGPISLRDMVIRANNVVGATHANSLNIPGRHDA
jgi:hypothetical protein